MPENLPARPRFPELGVIALVPDPWGPQWQTRHHVLARLADYFHVVWVNPARSWRQLLSPPPRDGRRAEEVPSGAPEVYQPELWLPDVGRPNWLARWTLRQRLTRARGRLLRHGCRRIVLYLWRPGFANALDLVPHDLSCYHIDDEYSYSPQDLPVDAQELCLIRRAGQVFIHSPAMMEKKGAFNLRTDFIPNGVDYQNHCAPAPEPADLSPIPRPRIGYSGVLKNQLDWPLLLQLSARHPEWSFVFVGATSSSWKSDAILPALSGRSNVHFLGAKTTPELAPYAQHFDVCLMPYRVDGYTKFIYPLKLHEYLASGTPVVGSRIPTLQAFAPAVSLAEGPEEWSRAVEQALSPEATSSAARTARQKLAQDHDWGIIVGRIAELIGRRLGVDASAACEIPAGDGSPQLSVLR